MSCERSKFACRSRRANSKKKWLKRKCPEVYGFELLSKLEAASCDKKLHGLLPGSQIVVNFLCLRFRYVCPKLTDKKEKKLIGVSALYCKCAGKKGGTHALCVNLYPRPNCRRVKLPSGDGGWVRKRDCERVVNALSLLVAHDERTLKING